MYYFLGSFIPLSQEADQQLSTWFQQLLGSGAKTVHKHLFVLPVLQSGVLPTGDRPPQTPPTQVLPLGCSPSGTGCPSVGPCRLTRLARVFSPP